MALRDHRAILVQHGAVLVFQVELAHLLAQKSSILIPLSFWSLVLPLITHFPSTVVPNKRTLTRRYARHSLERERPNQQLHATSHPMATRESSGFHCTVLQKDEIVLSRPNFIVALTVCITITCISLLGLMALSYREWDRQRQIRSARAYGRKSRYFNRISMLRKKVDDDFSRQYSGCLYTEPENPYLVPRTPVELGSVDQVFEVPAKVARPDGDQRKSRVKSLFFDGGRGMWFPKQ